MARRLNTWEQIWAFIGPRLKSKFGRPIPYWFFLDVLTTCNMRCGYCFVIEPKRAKIDLSVAKQSIDFMHEQGCRVVAFMGGEPLLLGDSLVEIIEYATSKRMFTYLPTNLSLLNARFLNDLITAGTGCIDAGIDAIEKRDGFDKNLAEAQQNFDLVLESRKRGVHVKLNTVITRENVDDVYQLVELSRSKKIPISLHLIEGEPPETPQKEYGWLQKNWHFRNQDYPTLERLANWLIEKRKKGYPIANPAWYFERMKEMVRDGHHSGWKCLAGQHTLFINMRGEFAPCLALIWQENKKWGNLKEGKWPFDKQAMEAQLSICNSKCLSCSNTLTTYGELHPFAFLKPHIQRRLKFLWHSI